MKNLLKVLFIISILLFLLVWFGAFNISAKRNTGVLQQSY
ncbi:MAG: hypothetical protein Rpha_2176 [Candidatus Ruthia sp. Apha_13_S6]|nr:hypothetical protein [Candidatus Ruthia sp. Apha_13_S6]